MILETWKIIEIKCCKVISNAKTRTQNDAGFTELGRIPMYVLCKERIMLYFYLIVSNKTSVVYEMIDRLID